LKKVTKCLILVAVMFGTFIGNANVKTGPSTNASSYANESRVFVSIIDEMGKTIFSGEVKHANQFYQNFNFSILKDGIYTVEVNYDLKVEITTVEVKNDHVSVMQNERIVFFKPSIKIEKNKVIVSKLASEDEEMKVEIFYKEDKILKDVLEGKRVLARAYILDETLKGDYAVQIKTNGRVYDQNFKF
jgi:hypothetical protein